MDRKRQRALAARARAGIGPVSRQGLHCLACGDALEAVYRQAPERIQCPSCGKRAAVRDDDEPYPQAPDRLPM
jgi:predicted RNA-binding Zn-ribbon protein involved in translation (DUF1610 family)